VRQYTFEAEEGTPISSRVFQRLVLWLGRRGWDFCVGLDAGAFPVGLGDRGDGVDEGDASNEKVVDAAAEGRMGATSGEVGDAILDLNASPVSGPLMTSGDTVRYRGNVAPCRLPKTGRWISSNAACLTM
jgi:hypothetical protein